MMMFLEPGLQSARCSSQAGKLRREVGKDFRSRDASERHLPRRTLVPVYTI
jgi:hypothetical protein